MQNSRVDPGSQDDYLDALVPFITDGLDAGHAVLVAVPQRPVVNELATAALMHSGGPCQLALWRQDGYLVCEARDNGHLADPLAGRRPYGAS